MGEIRPKTCEGREPTKDQLGMCTQLWLLMAGACLCLCRAFPLADTAFGHAGEDCGDTCRALTGRDAPRLARKRRRWQQRRRE